MAFQYKDKVHIAYVVEILKVVLEEMNYLFYNF